MVDLAESVTVESVEEFRARLRKWLPHNLDRVGNGRAGDPHDPEHIAEHRLIQRRLFDGGFAGITWPARFGGGGLTAVHQSAFDEESRGYVVPDFGILSITTFGACVPTLLEHASEHFLSRHVPAVLRGEELWCQFFSEPAAGSDLAGVRTRATPDGDGWRLTGNKIWSSLAHHADWAMCLARTDFDVPKHRGLTWFALPTASAGLTIRPIQQIAGPSEFCEEFLDEVFVPDSERIGEPGAGWPIAGTLLVHERRSGGRGSATGDDPGPLNPQLLALARSRGSIGPRECDELVSIHIEEYVSRQLENRTGELANSGAVTPGVASYAKLFRSVVSAHRGRVAFELAGFGAAAWSEQEESQQGHDAGTLFMDSKKPGIAGGTEQMQRNSISERVLGLPREPSYDHSRPFSEVLRSSGDWAKPS